MKNNYDDFCMQRGHIKTVAKQTKSILVKMSRICIGIKNYGMVLKSEFFEKLFICFQCLSLYLKQY